MNTGHGLKWDMSKQDQELIVEIVNRMAEICREENEDLNSIECMMDIAAVHLNDIPLDLEKLLKADRFNLVHDVTGISRHLNRRTGKLKNSFLPRCTMYDIKESINAAHAANAL